MGLTIHYTLHAGTRPLSAIRSLVANLRSRAAELPFNSVSKILHFSGQECLPSGDNDPHAWLKDQAACLPPPHPDPHPNQTQPHPQHIVAFSIHPAHGCEQANFGFCATPPATRPHSRRPHKKLPAWSWASFCKTQYASNPTLGGMQNFLKAHLGLIQLLDHARNLGLLASVNDEGGYWQHRNPAALLREVGQWNNMIAAGYGVIRDAIEAAGHSPDQLQAPITTFPNLEYLEANGRLK